MDKSLKLISLHEKSNDRAFWMSKTPQERIDAIEFLRQQYQSVNNNASTRLQRVYTIIESTQR